MRVPNIAVLITAVTVISISAASQTALEYYNEGTVSLEGGDVLSALASLTKAVELEPKNGDYWDTLGVVCYRGEQWEGAIKALQKSMELGNGESGNSLFSLTIAHWQLGKKDEAGQWYNRAVEWMEKNQPDNNELRRFRVEAAELLGISEQPDANEVAPLKE